MSSRPPPPNSLSRFYNPTPLHLRALVLDYLCHNAYTKTARIFAQTSKGHDISEQDTSEPVELSEDVVHRIEQREQIRIHISNGEVHEATELLLKHFPGVLNDAHATPTATGTGTHFPHLTSVSIEPAHLSLNLKILALVEALRTYPLSSPNSDKQPASDPEPLSEHDLLRKHADLLMKARKIKASIQMLPDDEDRKMFITELENVTGLLAYKIPEESNIAPTYFSQGRRDAVAAQVNSAILYRTGRPPVSYLESYTRHTATVWSMMHQMNVKAPPPPLRPQGARLPPTTEQPAPKTFVKASEQEAQDVVPSFDLQNFLDTKT